MLRSPRGFGSFDKGGNGAQRGASGQNDHRLRFTLDVSSSVEPMHDVRLSESLYRQATDAARAQRVSVEEFVSEAVQLRLRDPGAITLTSEQLAKVRHAQAQVKAGEVLTMEQVEQRSAANRAKWPEENRP